LGLSRSEPLLVSHPMRNAAVKAALSYTALAEVMMIKPKAKGGSMINRGKPTAAKIESTDPLKRAEALLRSFMTDLTAALARVAIARY
jgi:hypothetical protein